MIIWLSRESYYVIRKECFLSLDLKYKFGEFENLLKYNMVNKKLPQQGELWSYIIIFIYLQFYTISVHSHQFVWVLEHKFVSQVFWYGLFDIFGVDDSFNFIVNRLIPSLDNLQYIRQFSNSNRTPTNPQIQTQLHLPPKSNPTINNSLHNN